MMKVRNMGKKSLDEVQNKLAMMGLSLATRKRLPQIAKESARPIRCLYL